MWTNSAEQPAIDTLRLSDSEIETILNHLDAREQTAGPSIHQRRKFTRLSYRGGTVLMSLDTPGMPSRMYRTRPRNLSRGGVALLHGGFVYDNTPCAVLLHSLTGRIVRVTGEVVRCRHIGKNVHEVGVAFTQPIKVEDFIPLEGDANAPRQTIPQLKGNVLCITAASTDLSLLWAVLCSTEVQLDVAANLTDGLQRIAERKYDVTFIESQTGNRKSLTYPRVLRDANYRGAIVALTSLTSDSVKDLFMQSGYSHVLLTPLRMDNLTTLLTTVLAPPPVTSSLWSNPIMRPLLLGFLDQVEAAMHNMGTSLDGGSRVQLQEACRVMRDTAGVLGFEKIHELTAVLHDRLSSGAPMAAVRDVFADLKDICESARENARLKQAG